MTTKHLLNNSTFVGTLNGKSKSHVLYLYSCCCLPTFETCLFPLICFSALYIAWLCLFRSLYLYLVWRIKRIASTRMRRKKKSFFPSSTTQKRWCLLHHIWVWWCVNRHFTRCITFCGLYILKCILCCFSHFLSLYLSFVSFSSSFFFFSSSFSLYLFV